jgi:hypothetical protein
MACRVAYCTNLLAGGVDSGKTPAGKKSLRTLAESQSTAASESARGATTAFDVRWSISLDVKAVVGDAIHARL